jgi:hypothetical protein
MNTATQIAKSMLMLAALSLAMILLPAAAMAQFTPLKPPLKIELEGQWKGSIVLKSYMMPDKPVKGPRGCDDLDFGPDLREPLEQARGKEHPFQIAVRTERFIPDGSMTFTSKDAQDKSIKIRFAYDPETGVVSTHPDSLKQYGPYTIDARAVRIRTVEKGHSAFQMAGEIDMGILQPDTEKQVGYLLFSFEVSLYRDKPLVLPSERVDL